MDQSVSLRYMRVVQQLEKKTDEVSQLLLDAQSLGDENSTLRRQNEDLLKRLEGMVRSDKQREEELSLLESQVKRQQQRLQQYIDNEIAAKNNSKSDMLAKRSHESKADNKTSQRKLQQDPEPPVLKVASSEGETELKNLKNLLGEERKKYAELQKDSSSKITDLAMYSKKVEKDLAEANASVHRREAELKEVLSREETYKNTLRHLNQRHAESALESQQMEAVEAKALQGIQAELVALEAENSRLRTSLQEERHQYRAARLEFEKTSKMLEGQKALFDAHQKISAEEIQALTMQLEALLGDIRSQSEFSTREAECFRLKLQKQLPEVHAPSASPTSRNVALISRATQESLNDQGHRRLDVELEEKNHVLQQKLSTALDTLEELSQEHQDLSRQKAGLLDQISSLERELLAARDALHTHRSILQERSSIEDIKKERNTILAQKEIEDDETRKKIKSVRKIETDALRDVVARCAAQSVALQQHVESITRTNFEEIKLALDLSLSLADPELRNIFEISTELLSRLKSCCSSLTKYVSETRQPSVVASPYRQTPQSVSQRRFVRYSDGESLKEVVDEWRRSPSRPRSQKQESVPSQLRNPLSLTQWESRKAALASM